MSRRPNFVIAGAPKSGTTALYEYLQTHPQVFVTDPKEPHFYADDIGAHREVFSREYEALFARASERHLAVGEASAWYLHSSVALEKLAAEIPEIKVIVMLRQPAEFLRSLHSDLVWVNFEDETDFERAWGLQAERQAGRRIPRLCQVPWFLQYRQLGQLGRLVQRLLGIFPAEQVKLVLLDDLKCSPAGVYHDVLDFLGLPADGRREFPQVNAGKRNRLAWLSKLQAAVVRSLPRSYIQTGKYFGLGHISRALTQINSRPQTPAPLRDEFRQQLLTEFSAEIDQLEALLGRSLEAWRV